MKAVLLAAGMATRLRPLTDNVPKCLVPVGGKPVIQYNVEWLRDHGVREVAVNLHHRPEEVRRFLGSGTRFGVTVHYSFEEELLGTAGAVGRLADWLGGEDFVVVYADNVIVCDLEALRVQHLTLTATLTMALYWRADVTASGVATVDPQGRITTFVEKPAKGEVDSHWVHAGLMVCRPDVPRFIPAGRFSDFGRDVFPELLASGHIVGGYRMGGAESLHWIDTPEDLRTTEEALSRRPVPR